MIIKNALVFTLDNGFVKKDVRIEDGKFTKIEDELAQEQSTHLEKGVSEVVIDAQGDYLIPGLVDVHFHGCAGYDFSDASREALDAICAYELKHGITSICPASMTLPQEKIYKICEETHAYAKLQRMTSAGQRGARLCGIHLEGPFIASEKKGAQNPAYIQSPSVGFFREMQKASGGLVKLITLAPEVVGAEEFVREVADEVHISVGHTMSDCETASRIFQLGADHVTHIYNAMPGFSHRAPGVIGAAFDAKHVMTELICDGVHVEPAAVRMTFQLFGEERIVLISDSMMATGMADGMYSLGELPVTVQGNLATLADGTIAGSVTNLMDCMKTAVEMGIPLEIAVRAASYNPAKSIGVDDVCGSIEVGKYGDCVILSKEDLTTKRVIFGGKIM